MKALPNFKEFYQKGLVPIGAKDKDFLLSADNQTEATHWLIAVEGEQDDQLNEQYRWKVSMYLSDNFGSFISRQPYYSSTEIPSVHTAFDKAAELEFTSRNDSLTTTELYS